MTPQSCPDSDGAGREHVGVTWQAYGLCPSQTRSSEQGDDDEESQSPHDRGSQDWDESWKEGKEVGFLGSVWGGASTS